MYLILILILILILLFFISLFLKKYKYNKVINCNFSLYKKKDYLLTKAEKYFYDILLKSLKETNYTIFTKIRLADIIYLPSKTTNRQSYFNKIKSKHVDFIICDNKKISPLLIIELDDSTHKQEKRMERDKFVNDLLKEINLPILHIPVKFTYNSEELKEMITKNINEIIVIDKKTAEE